jgi:hypothetical protein
MSKDVPFVLSSLVQLYEVLKQKSLSTSKSTQTSIELSPLCKFPIKTLLKILSYLDFQSDIPQLSESCKFFNRFLSSYAVQFIFYKQSTKKLGEKSEKEQIEQEFKVQDSLMALTREEITTKYSKLLMLKEKLSMMLEKAEEKTKELLQNKNKLIDDVKIT